MPNLTAIKLALKFAKYAKNPDKRIREEIMKNAPPEIKDKLNRIMDAYEKAKKGELPRDVAIKTIANELGFEQTNDLLEMVNDLLDLMKEEMENYEPRLEPDFVWGEKDIAKESNID